MTQADISGQDHHDPLPMQARARIRQAFLLGLARQPLSTPPSLAAIADRLPRERDSTLALLALAGQRQRFTRPAPAIADPTADAARRLHEDPRPVLSAAARRALMRLDSSVEKALAQGVLTIALRRIREAGQRPHPFDLPAVARHLKANSDALELAERAYLALVGDGDDEETVRSLLDAPITADTWTGYPKSQRRGFIVGVRRDDPAAGRALVEGVWKSEPAATRLVLLEALGTGLDAADKPFLESLAKDRAETVRQLAAALLARIPDPDNDARRVAEAAACFPRRSATGVARLMSIVGIESGGGDLKFEIPDDPRNDWGKRSALRQRLFAGVPVGAIAAACCVTTRQIVAALPAEETVVLDHFIETAQAAGETSVVRQLTAARLLSSSKLAAPDLIALASRTPSVVLSPAAAKRFLSREAWRMAVAQLVAGRTPSEQKDDGRLVFAAALMPNGAIAEFLASIDPVPPSASRAARDFADLVLALPEPASAIDPDTDDAT